MTKNQQKTIASLRDTIKELKQQIKANKEEYKLKLSEQKEKYMLDRTAWRLRVQKEKELKTKYRLKVSSKNPGKKYSDNETVTTLSDNTSIDNTYVESLNE